MNEVVKVLLRKAGLFTYIEGFVGSYGSDRVSHDDIIEYTRVIIEECIERCKTDWCDDSLDDILGQMKTHFGIE